MLTIDVKVTALYPRTIFIQWEVENNLVVGDVLFDIYKAHSPSGEFTKVNNLPEINTFYFQDHEEVAFSKLYNVHYKVVLTDPLKRQYESKVTSLDTSPENSRHYYSPLRIAREINRTEKILLNKFTGVTCILLKRRHFGEKCSDCFNFVTEEVTNSHCKVCYGTGFVGGYHKPIQLRAQFDAIVQSQRLTDQLAVREESNNSAWINAVPYVKKADVLVQVNSNTRWFIHDVQVTSLQSSTVRQTLQIKEIEHANIAYSVPIENPAIL